MGLSSALCTADGISQVPRIGPQFDSAFRKRLPFVWVTQQFNTTNSVGRLTVLAPEIVVATLAGRPPHHLNLHRVRGREAHIPWDWGRQREPFGPKAAERAAGSPETAGKRAFTNLTART